MDMDVGRRRESLRNGGVIAGSVWESRMKVDEVKGGIKVFNADDNSINKSEPIGEIITSTTPTTKVRSKQGVIGVSVRRRTWKSESGSSSSPEGSEKIPNPISRRKSEVKKNLDDLTKDLNVFDGIKKNPIQMKKNSRSEMVVNTKELPPPPPKSNVDGVEKNPIQKTKTRSEEHINDGTQKSPIPIRKSKSESVEGNERNSIPPRRVKSESIKGLSNESADENEGAKSVPVNVPDQTSEIEDGIQRNSIQLKEEKLDSGNVVDKSHEGHDGSYQGTEKNPIEIKASGSDETCTKLNLSQEQVISSSLSNMGQVKSAPLKDDEEFDDEEFDEEEIEDEIGEKSFDDEKIKIPEQIPKQIVKEVKKIHQIQEKPLPITPIVKKQPPLYVNKPRIHPIPTKAVPTPVSSEFQRMPETNSKLQSLVDLVMWRDASKSAFVFGTGTFVIMSSSYTEDLNISSISVISYLSLIYLALTFLYRSIIYRGDIDMDDEDKGYAVVGEEEVVWLMKLILPYLNEFLLKLKALFSGDPATTMKLAVLLFFLARGGSSITLWKMVKLGFFGAFTVPKVCSSYSTQLTGFGKFWVRRFGDAWDTCSHKKAVAFGIFTLVWNLSSVVARIWALFMLYVAFKYYQQSLMGEDWVYPQAQDQDTWQGSIGEGGGRIQRRGPTSVRTKKSKKTF